MGRYSVRRLTVLLIACLMVGLQPSQGVATTATLRSMKHLVGEWTLESVNSAQIQEPVALTIGIGVALRAEDGCLISYATGAKVAKKRLILTDRITYAKPPATGCVAHDQVFRVIWNRPTVKLIGKKLVLESGDTLVYRRWK
jgi:hypothetical protein